MNPVFSRHYPLKCTTLLLILTVTFFSCKKVDIKPGSQNVVERFLQLPANASPQLTRIVEDLKTKEKDHPFIEQFVAKLGYPLWEHAAIKKAKPKTHLLAKEEGEEIVEIPVIQDQKQFVNALLEVKLDTELLYKLLEGDKYANYGFDKDAALNADKVVSKLMAYEKTIWNRQIFKIDDNRLFSYWNPGVEKPSSFFVQLVTNNITNDMIVYVYGDCEDAGTVGTDDGGDSGGDGDDWTYVNGGELTGHIPGQSYTWVEPNSGGSSGSPNAPKPICLNDIVHIQDNAGGGTGGWSSSPILSGGSGGGGSSGSDESPCTPFPWVPWGVRPGTYTLYNPCLEQPIEPGGGNISNSSVQDLTNNVTNPCLLEVYNRITASGYKNKVAQMLNNFTSNTTICVTINQTTGLSDSRYGETYGTGGENYNIDLNVNVLPHCSQEWVALNYFHEAIHAYLKNHLNDWDFQNNSEHKQMFENYFTDMVSSIKSLFPGLSDRDARCLVFYQMSVAEADDTSAPENQRAFSLMKNAILARILNLDPTLHDEDGVLNAAQEYDQHHGGGTRTTNCN